MDTSSTTRERSSVSENNPNYLQRVVHCPTTRLMFYWDEFTKHFKREGKSDVTIKKTRDALEFVMKNCGILTIEQCNTPRILREALFEQKEKRGWQNSTFNSYVKGINTYFIWLEDMEYIDENKIKKIRKCKQTQNEQPTLNEEQIRAIVGHLRTRGQTRLERWRNDLLFGIFIVTGARPCEVLEIRCSQMVEKLDGGFTLCIKGKKQKGRVRYYDLPSWVVEAYKIYMSIRVELERYEDKLFISTSRKMGFTYQGLRKLCKNLSDELGFSVTAYGIRRFVATKLNAENLAMRDIMSHLGHTRASTTMGYIQSSSKLTQRGTDVMKGVF